LPEIDQFQLAQDKVREERLRVGLESEIRAHRGLCDEFSKVENENAELESQNELILARLHEAQNTANQVQELLQGSSDENAGLIEKLERKESVERENVSLSEGYDKLVLRNRLLTGATIFLLATNIWTLRS